MRRNKTIRTMVKWKCVTVTTKLESEKNRNARVKRINFNSTLMDCLFVGHHLFSLFFSWLLLTYTHFILTLIECAVCVRTRSRAGMVLDCVPLAFLEVLVSIHTGTFRLTGDRLGHDGDERACEMKKKEHASPPARWFSTTETKLVTVRCLSLGTISGSLSSNEGFGGLRIVIMNYMRRHHRQKKKKPG